MKRVFWLFALFVLAGSALAQEALPDLKVEMKPISFKLTRVPAYIDQSNNFRLSPGDLVTISVEVSNKGQAASGPFTLEVVLDKNLDNRFENLVRFKTFSKKFADLKPAEKASFDQDFQIDAPEGDIRCQIKIAAMVKDDWNPSDNILSCGTILYWQNSFVSEYLRPDLAVELTSPDSTRSLTFPVRLRAKVTNEGHAVSRSTDLVLKCKEKDAKRVVVPPLKPGESFTHTFEHKWYTLGNKNCTATVNASGRTNDKGSQNNSASLTVTIK